MDPADLGEVRPEPFNGVSPELRATEPALALHALAGQIGAEVAAPLSAALERVNQLATSGQIGKRSLRLLREEIERARRVAMMGQQISRLARGRIRQVPEALDLPQLLRDTLAQRGREIDARGLEVHQVLKPARASADPTLTFTLLQSIVDWAFEHCCGRTIELQTDTRSWPVRAQLSCAFDWRPADQADEVAEGAADPRKLDTMAWRLVERVAHSMGVRVERQDTASQARLRLEFPQMVETSPALGAPIEADDAVPVAPNSEPLAGSHVLVVSPRREVRNLVREALRGMGLMVDYVTSSAEAREFCRGGMPHAVVFDGVLVGFDGLKGELQAEVAGLAFLQVSDEASALEVDARGRDQQARIGLQAIVESLPAALSYALARSR